MAAGLAVIAVCPPWSDLAKLVTENDIGWVIRNSEHTSETLEGSGNYQSALERFRNPKEIGGEIAHLLLRLQSAPEELRLKQQNARRVALDRYSTLPIADLWKRYITRIEMPPES